MKNNGLKVISERYAPEMILERYLRSKFCLTVGQIKAKAEKQKIPFNITVQDVIDSVVDVCPVFGITIDYLKEGKGSADNSPSIDRLDPIKGYVKGNIQIICQKANRMKSNCSEDEVQAILDYIKSMNNKK